MSLYTFFFSTCPEQFLSFTRFLPSETPAPHLHIQIASLLPPPSNPQLPRRNNETAHTHTHTPTYIDTHHTHTYTYAYTYIHTIQLYKYCLAAPRHVWFAAEWQTLAGLRR